MAILYEFICPECLARFVVTDRLNPNACPVCGYKQPRRKYSFSIGSSFQDHYNDSVGHYVRNRREFTDSLKIQSEEMSHRLGYDVNYQPVDVADKDALGVTEEGMDATYKTHRDKGI